MGRYRLTNTRIAREDRGQSLSHSVTPNNDVIETWSSLARENGARFVQGYPLQNAAPRGYSLDRPKTHSTEDSHSKR